MITIQGKVIRGEARGAKFFVPTINLAVDDLPKSLKFGVYAVRVFIKNKAYFGAMHYGRRVTLDNKLTLEINIFEFEDNIYGQEVGIEVLKKIREVKKFDFKEELKKAINNDIVLAKEIGMHSKIKN